MAEAVVTASGSEVVLRALDTLALRLVDHGHHWSTEDRRLYERAVARLGGHSAGGGDGAEAKAG